MSDPQVMAYFVDQVGGNFLFRGTTPDLDPNSGFDYGAVQSGIAAAAKAAGVDLPESYYLVDICLLQTANTGEVPSIVAEYQNFQQNPEQGQVQFWSTEGVGIDPTLCLDADQRNYLVTSLACWLPDPLVDRICALRAWLEGNYDAQPIPLPAPVPANTAVVCYVHCNGGCDRTGEVIAAYSMQYLGKNWLEANQANYECCYGGQQPFGCGNYNAARWYCLYLSQLTGQDLGCSETPSYPNFGSPCNHAYPSPCYPCPPTAIFPCP